MDLRPACPGDRDALWRILEPVIRRGETYALPREWDRDATLTYWLAPEHAVFVAVDQPAGEIVGTYYLRANQKGGGAHVANCGYATAEDAQGRGVASAMCAHSLATAAARGFAAMQFNLVVATNTRAIALWRRLGFRIVGTLPEAFDHPALGRVDAHVMHRMLDPAADGAAPGPNA